MPRVCVASSFPGSINVNIGIVRNLAEGFKAILGDENVFLVSFESVADQTRRLRPDLVVLVGSALPTACDYRAVARAAAAVDGVFAYWTVEDPYEFDYNWRFTDYADIVFSNDEWAVEFYERDHVYHLPTAASPTHYRSLDGYDQRGLEVFFCGVGFRNRQRFILDALPVLERYRSLITGENLPQVSSQVVMNRRIPSENLVDYYSAAKVVLNLGRDHFLANNSRSLQPTTPGPRTFEAAMAGCVQIYFQPSYHLETCFAPGEEIVTIDSIDELEAELARILASPEEAHAIARRAQERCLRDHTYAVRARKILQKANLTAVDTSLKIA